MENQTRFDLNTALENWRTELAAQPSLSAENRRELETHLRDTFAEMKVRSLSEEESFRLASKKLGQLPHIEKEFQKNKVLIKRRHAFGFGASFGLATGLSMFLIGLYLAHCPGSVLISPFLLLHAPALGLLLRLHGTAYEWNSNAGLSQLLAAFLIYWAFLGILAGLAIQKIGNRRCYKVSN